MTTSTTALDHDWLVEFLRANGARLAPQLEGRSFDSLSRQILDEMRSDELVRLQRIANADASDLPHGETVEEAMQDILLERQFFCR